MQSTYSNITEANVRFSEVDSAKIVWHGNYLKYFEDGRDAFAKQFGLNYLYFAENDLSLPIVHLDIFFAKPLRYTDRIEIHTTLILQESAKMVFNYELFKLPEKELVCRGSTTQVFVNSEGKLHFVEPKFFKDWKNNKLLNQ